MNYTIYEFNRTYLEFALLYKFKVTGQNGLYMLTGPSFAYLIDSQLSGRHEQHDLNGNMKKVTKSFDVGLNFAVGLSYSIGSSYVFLEGRYVHGMLNTAQGGKIKIMTGSQSAEGYLSNKDVFESRSILILAGIIFPIN